MLSPFDNPIPTGYLQKIEAYARDLAWGVEQGYWERQLTNYNRFVMPRILSEHRDPKFGVWFNDIKDNGGINLGVNFCISLENIEENKRGFYSKWFIIISDNGRFEAICPSSADLRMMGFLDDPQGEPTRLSLIALELLTKPSIAPSVFISYRRKFSSPFALAIEARLRGVGHHNIFIDKDIEAGEEWLEVLKERISLCDYFVFLVDQNVFESKWMREEYELAKELGKTIIPIIHPEVDMDKFDETFKATQFIDCRGDKSASSYEDGINRLLSRLGYATY